MGVYATSILRNHAPRHGATAKRYISPQPTPPSHRPHGANDATAPREANKARHANIRPLAPREEG